MLLWAYCYYMQLLHAYFNYYQLQSILDNSNFVNWTTSLGQIINFFIENPPKPQLKKI